MYSKKKNFIPTQGVTLYKSPNIAKLTAEHDVISALLHQ